ncbi:MAG: response regulator [Erythrobacter sp.]|uniref:response regulator transcription factor n=1 Tax=Erythrobacter sp. TaxID=1042 RepID=UPI0025F9713C|nr:response regulator [Erythrobacter sp.]MCL9997950.1 response regulator [Erythrobacter sp.]
MNVYVVDDDAELRESLASYLGGCGYAVQMFASGAAFLSVAEDLTPGCIVLDLRMPDLDGLALQRALCEMQSGHQIVLLSGYGEVQQAVRAIRAGAIDFLTKPCPPEQVLGAVEHARANLAQVRQREDAKILLKRLTEREQAILHASAGGKASKQVAHELSLSIRTIEAHRSRIIHKLGAQNFAGALLIAQGCDS